MERATWQMTQSYDVFNALLAYFAYLQVKILNSCEWSELLALVK